MTIDRKLLAGVSVLVAIVARFASAQDMPSGTGTMPMGQSAPVSSAWREQFTGPGAPTKPTPASRPSTWPGGGPIDTSPGAPHSASSLPPGELHSCDGTGRLAVVGQEVILEGDVVTPPVKEFILKSKDRMPPEEFEAQRMMLIRQSLQRRIETLLITQDAKRTIPSEGWTHVQSQLGKLFEDQELDKMMKQSNAASRGDLDRKLREFGSSLERVKMAWCEHELARQWVTQQVKPNDEVTYDQMVTYYRKHRDDFATRARAKWEELMVSYARYPSREAARDAIGRLGNQVLAGAPLADVAKTASDGVTAADGGRRDWTGKGSLVCREIDEVIFSLPIGQLSQIIEGPTGFHIVRVTQREEERVAPFLDAQRDIRDKIVKQRREKQIDEYLTKLKTRTPVWTVFDDRSTQMQMATPPSREPYRR
ncbi:MAG: peptidyl-prolyl cis-trans isomerase [Planctomycetaceae bacterium]|nr:peptidyl-prolyl cis-trans isomerase [Planctomycetaceae bacterium]